MDLGIKGKRALVCASSKGLGLGCARALAAEGVDLIMNARGADALEAAAGAIRTEFGVDVVTVACDVSTPEGQTTLIEAAQGVDILVNNAGGPPPGMWTDWDREDFIKALDANMLAPIALMKALVPGMMERGWGRVVNITSQSVKARHAVTGGTRGVPESPAVSAKIAWMSRWRNMPPGPMRRRPRLRLRCVRRVEAGQGG